MSPTASLLKALSIITGTPQETLLNAWAEIPNNFGSKILNNNTEQSVYLRSISNNENAVITDKCNILLNIEK